MNSNDASERRERWARLRFAVVGPLLASPPPAGQLRAELERLAEREWEHPCGKGPVRFAASTVERWYYQARAADNDPVGALKRRPLHPEKTRMVEFCSPAKSKRGGSQREHSFAMLGFTHYWGRSRTGRWVVKRKTAKDRFSRALKGIGQWCRKHRHWKIRDQHAVLSHKLRGHYAYYGMTGNFPALRRFRTEVGRKWCKWLGRRSWSGRMTWDRFTRVLKTYPLPPARVVHSVYR